MSQGEKKTCYKIEVAPEDHNQNCDMWDFDNLNEGNVYINSIHFREFINIVSPMIVFGLLSSASKMHFFDNMRGTFLGGASINAMRFFAPIVVFKKSFIPYINDNIYSMSGQDNILQLAKDINKILDGICSVEFILNWLGSCCIPYGKEQTGEGLDKQRLLLEQRGEGLDQQILVLEQKRDNENQQILVLKKNGGDAGQQILVLEKKRDNANQQILVLKKNGDDADQQILVLGKTRENVNQKILDLKNKVGEAGKQALVVGKDGASTELGDFVDIILNVGQQVEGEVHYIEGGPLGHSIEEDVRSDGDGGSLVEEDIGEGVVIGKDEGEL